MTIQNQINEQFAGILTMQRIISHADISEIYVLLSKLEYIIYFDLYIALHNSCRCLFFFIYLNILQIKLTLYMNNMIFEFITVKIVELFDMKR